MISFMHLLMVIWAFLAGLVFSYLTFSPGSQFPNFFVLIKRKKQDRKKDDDEFSLMKKVCPVCGESNCPRHRPELNILALQPWTNLFISERVDIAIEELLNLVLKNYVYTWYKDISNDEAFVDELRTSIRFMAAILFRRLKKVDLPVLIVDKLIRAGLSHFHCYQEVKKKVGNKSEIQQEVFNSLGTNLHIAMQSRATELEYLRKVIDNLFPYILSKQSLQCRSLCALLREILSGSLLLPLMDILADPDIINKLILLLIDSTPPPTSNEPPSDDVTILASFSVPGSVNKSSLHMDGIAEILHDQEALFPFMQFLKQEASVNVLMFCLAAEDFNQNILNPELTFNEKKRLHEEANELYDVYFSPTAADKILFDDDIVHELKSICDDPPDQIIKLQTRTCLFQAYEHAYNLLETTFLPLFHQSDDYYIWLCGNRHTSNLVRSSSRKNRGAEQFGLSKIGNKLKGVFKSQTVEGKILDDYLDTETAEDLMAGSDILTDSFLDDESQDEKLHDLSSWRVNIPSIETSPDPDNPKKVYHTFMIEVRRLDVLEQDEFQASNWSVNRRYNEFYVMEQKLKEFHGEFPECKMQPKKTLGTKGAEFLESKRTVFELYLQKLLTIPKLKGSQLLFTFLTSDDELTTSLLPDINFGKMFKSVPLKLVKERGQHLDPFLASFMSSTETAKPRPSREDRDSDTVSISSENLANPMYENNANIETITSTTDVQFPNKPAHPFSGIYDTIMYLAENVFAVQPWVRHLLMSIRIVGRQSLEHYVDWFIGQKLDKVLQEHRIVNIIHSLRDVLFFDDDPPRTDKDKIARREEALQSLIDYIPNLAVKLIGKEANIEGVTLVFDAVQNPKLNKQLSYTLLDCLLVELFPELQDGSNSPAEL